MILGHLCLERTYTQKPEHILSLMRQLLRNRRLTDAMFFGCPGKILQLDQIGDPDDPPDLSEILAQSKIARNL